jgi:NADPH:quinone reductase-like Zn-dependent oxidoreductase
MRQVWIPRIGEPSVLEVREAPDPKPGRGEVRIAVEACGVNFADAMARMGLYPDSPKLPAVVGYEIAGAIDDVGEGVDRSRIGEPVLALTHFGGYTSHAIVGSKMAMKRPAGLDARSAAAIPVTGLTTWMMLVEMARVREGDRVLVHSAGGGVGLMALDLIKWRKGYAIGTASKAKHEFLTARGYDELIDYRTEDFEAVLSQGPGLDVVLDPVGGESWRKSFRVLRAGGKLICYGFSTYASGTTRNIFAVLRSLWAIPWLTFNPITVLNANKGVMGVNMGRAWGDAERLKTWLIALLDLWSQGVVRPHVHAAVPFSHAPEAHRLLHARENIGKVVLVP